jgi:Carbohydrate esterase, sialic acid-specific acetylesterase
MLLWHAGFDRLDSNYLAESRLIPLGATPPIVADAFRRPAGKALWLGTPAIAGLAGTVETEPLQVSSDSEVLIAGFAVYLTSEGADDRVLMSVFSGASEQGRLYRRKNTGGLFFFEYCTLDGSGNVRATAGRSPVMPFPTTVFVELRVFFSNSGNVELRLNGSRVFYNRNIATESSSVVSRSWTKLRFYAAGQNDRWSDFYACNDLNTDGPQFASFLGDTQSTKLAPSRDGRLQQWLPANAYVRLPGTAGADPAAAGVDLIVLAGQSNAQGTGFCPLPVVGLPDPNNFFWTWDKRAIPPAWRSLEGGVNNNNNLLLSGVGSYYGPEMVFAGFLQIHAQAASATLTSPCSIGLVKGAQSSAALFPTFPDFCWDPATAGNLYNGHAAAAPFRGSLLLDVTNAIAALGGRSRVNRIHFFWYQGESDGFFDFSTAQYKQRLTQFLALVRSDQEAQPIPIPVTVHLVQIHKKLKKASAPNAVDGFWFTESIRAIQRDVAFENGYVLVTVDDIPLAPDEVHYTQAGQNVLGQRFMQSYLDNRVVHRLLNGLGVRSAGLQAIRGHFQGAKSTFHFTGASSLRGSRVLATTEKITGSSSSTSLVQRIEEAGTSIVAKGSFSLPISTTIVAVKETKATMPERLETTPRGYETL